jgi:hypothetical protein
MTNATRRRSYYNRHREKILAQQKTPEARERDRQLHEQRKDEINARRREIYKTKPPPNDKRLKQKSEAMKRWQANHGKAYGAKRRERDAERRGATSPRPQQCEVCGRRNGKHGIALDHCHQTGGFRGWLCYSCNTILGHAGDNPKILRDLITYLERS